MDDPNLAPSKVTINGQEYDETEIQSNLEFAKQVRESEQKYNTTFDKVWPEYGRTQQTVKQLQTELQAAKAQIESFQSKQEQGTETIQDEKLAREAARKLGLTFQEDLEKSGYIKKDQVPELVKSILNENKAVESILREAEKLEGEINGSDGRPKFNKKAVLAYANAYGKNDLMEVYEEMHEDTLKTWKQAQVDLKRQPGLKTLKGTPGNKEPKKVNVTDDNVKDLLKERLWGGQGE
jgi:hypothetical protein